MDSIDSLLKKHGYEPTSGWSHCDYGWLDIIDRMLGAFRAAGYMGQFGQIKEKFATLTVYHESRYDADGEPDNGLSQEEFDAIRHTFAKEAAQTCQFCGSARAKLMKNGYWLYTLCQDCWDAAPWSVRTPT